jgi:hypothetical protein
LGQNPEQKLSGNEREAGRSHAEPRETPTKLIQANDKPSDIAEIAEQIFS